MGIHLSDAMFIPGVPAPQGSAKAFVVGKIKPHAVVTHDNGRTVPWRDTIRSHVLMADPRRNYVIDNPVGPVIVRCEFVMPRPKSLPKRSTPPHTKRPDTDKLARAVGDALTGLVYTDDSQVVQWVASKRYAAIDEKPGLWLSWSVDSRPPVRAQAGVQRATRESHWCDSPEAPRRSEDGAA